ncbi:hypothetical protein [Taibaiella soli]|uniref:Uncharacterized protein n=1 Tax=Taibaiella soli TaxID=1649169 RepID=A0A2W2ACQ8_9BACT|nr:hypothetical protein [Taibaiella soli]PZF71402.1 hypothetical protein DN068_19120 [Taibaiella soli]
MNLSETWFIEGDIDFELQKYKLLAYLQEVQTYFNETKLYPKLSDLIFHYNNLTSFRKNKKLLQDHFPKRIDEVNAEKLELVYQQMLADSELMQELENIIAFAIANIRPIIEDGTGIYEFVEKQLHIEPVGILPLYKNEGYVLLRYGSVQEVRVYSYTITLYEHKDARYRGIKMDLISSIDGGVIYTSEMIKREIIRNNPQMPNPAVYSIDTEYSFPLDETLLPIAKRLLVQYIGREKAA